MIFEGRVSDLEIVVGLNGEGRYWIEEESEECYSCD